MKNIIGILVSFVFIGFVIVSAKLVEKLGKEASRKYIHILLCNWWVIAMYFFSDAIWAAVVPFLFVMINYLSYKKDIIKVMERSEKDQDGLGTVYYAISLLVLAIVSFGIVQDPTIGLVGILVMGYGDGFAAIMGQKIKSRTYQVGNTKKSIAGSMTMFIITYGIVSFFLMTTPYWYLTALFVSLISTLTEAISIKGTDNITVPLLTSAMVYFVLYL